MSLPKNLFLDLSFQAPVDKRANLLLLILNQPDTNSSEQSIQEWKKQVEENFTSGDGLGGVNRSDLSLALSKKYMPINTIEDLFSFGLLKYLIADPQPEYKNFPVQLLYFSLLKPENIHFYLDVYHKKANQNNFRSFSAPHLTELKRCKYQQIFLGNTQKAIIFDEYFEKIYKEYNKKVNYSTRLTEADVKKIKDVSSFDIENAYLYSMIALLCAKQHYQEKTFAFVKMQEINLNIYKKVTQDISAKNFPINFGQTEDFTQDNYYPDLLSQFLTNPDYGKTYPEITKTIFEKLYSPAKLNSLSAKLQAECLFNVYQNDPMINRALLNHFRVRWRELLQKNANTDPYLPQAILQTSIIFSENKNLKNYQGFCPSLYNWCLTTPELYRQIKVLPQWGEFEKIVQQQIKAIDLQKLWMETEIPFYESFFNNKDTFQRLKDFGVEWTNTNQIELIKKIFSHFYNDDKKKSQILSSKRVEFFEVLVNELLDKNIDLLTNKTHPEGFSLLEEIKNNGGANLNILLETILLKKSATLKDRKKTNIFKL